VPPPTTAELLDGDPRRRVVDAIASGRWGLVLVFPWTTNRQIQTGMKIIRAAIRKQHRDALVNRHAQLVSWLEACGFDRPTIARAVFRRRSGLRRPTRAEVIRRTSEGRETQLYGEYRGLGLTHQQIQRKIYRRLRGSEALASASVRMTGQRYKKYLQRLNDDLAVPTQSEPLSHALTILFRGLPDDTDTTVRRHAGAVRDALLGAARVLLSAHRCDVPSSHQPLETALSSRWGLVPVFGWTTDPKIRASVTNVRTMMRSKPADGPPVQATGPNHFESLSNALIALVRALAGLDEAAVRRTALAARAAFLQVETS